MTAPAIRYVDEIGMYGFSRGRQTCRWPTAWCAQRCYMRKFYACNPRLEERDHLDNAFWASGIDAFVEQMTRLGIKGRFRFSVRGEIWQDRFDVEQVRAILEMRRDVLFWIPTRAWQDQDMRAAIEERIFPLANQRVLASIDPTVYRPALESLVLSGWSLVFAGDNDPQDQLELAPGGCDEKRTAHMFRCPKTWKYLAGHCATCEAGCFSAERVEVHLRQHR